MDSLDRLGVTSYIWEHYAVPGLFGRIVFCFLGDREVSRSIDPSSRVRIFRRPWSTLRPLRALFYGLRVPYYALRLARLILRERIDIVRARSAGYNAVAGILAAKLTGRPCAVSIHGPYAIDRKHSTGSFFLRSEDAIYEWLCLHLADHVYCVSTPMRSYAISMGTRPGRAKVLYNRVDVAKFQRRDRGREIRIAAHLGFPDHSKTLLTVGRLVPGKDHVSLLDALSILLHDDPTYRLVMIGSGWMRPQLESYVSRRNLEPCVRFEGNVEHDQLPSYFHLSDVFVFPTLYEGFGIVLIEAQAAGTPIVTTRIQGTVDVVSEANAKLVPVGDPEALADAIREVHTDPNGARERVERAMQDVMRFDEAVIRDKEIGLYRQLLASHNA